MICAMCGEEYTDEELQEIEEMGEHYHKEPGCFLCPDCWDDFNRLDADDQFKLGLSLSK